MIPVGEVLSDLGGPVAAIRAASPQARHHFTRFDQVNQLVSASETTPDLGFMARLLALCSLPLSGPSAAFARQERRLAMGEVMVDFDNNCIWGPLLTKAVGSLLPNAAREKLLAEKPEFVEDALNLLFSCTNREKIIKATLEWIRTTTVAGYHGSRLIDLEVDSIRSLGLLPLEAPARRERLVRALSCHPRWNEEALDAALLKYGEGNKAGHREGQVSLTLSRCGLLHGFNHYLAHGSEFDQRVAEALLGDEGTELLREDGKARIIQVAVPGPVALNRANRHFSIAARLERGELPNLVEDTRPPNLPAAAVRRDVQGFAYASPAYGSQS